jgi:hypothetical protein
MAMSGLAVETRLEYSQGRVSTCLVIFVSLTLRCVTGLIMFPTQIHSYRSPESREEMTPVIK